MTTRSDLDDAVDRLCVAMSSLDAADATTVAARAVTLLDTITAQARGHKAVQCARHRGQPAHNCGPCRAEHLGGVGIPANAQMVGG